MNILTTPIFNELLNHFSSNIFTPDGELNWKPIDYTTRSWLEFEKNGELVYIEKDDSRKILTLGSSIPDLEQEYGEAHFFEDGQKNGTVVRYNPDIPQWKMEEAIKQILGLRYNIKPANEVRELMKTPVENLEYAFSEKSYALDATKVLKSHGILTLGDLLGSKTSPEEAVEKFGAGDRGVAAIVSAVKKTGIEYGEHFLDKYQMKVEQEYTELYRDMINDGIIDPSEVYRLKELQKELGLSDEAVNRIQNDYLGLYNIENPTEAKRLLPDALCAKEFCEYFNYNLPEIIDLASEHRPDKLKPFIPELTQDGAMAILYTLDFSAHSVFADFEKGKFWLLDRNDGNEQREEDVVSLVSVAKDYAERRNRDEATDEVSKYAELINGLYSDEIFIPVDVRYKFSLPEEIKISQYDDIGRTPLEVCDDAIHNALIHYWQTELINNDAKLDKGRLALDYTYRHYIVASRNTDYSNIDYDDVVQNLQYSVGKSLNEAFGFDQKILFKEVTAFRPTEFHTARKRLVQVDDWHIDYFKDSPEQFADSLDLDAVRSVHSTVANEVGHFINEKKEFMEVLEANPLIRKFVEEKWQGQAIEAPELKTYHTLDKKDVENLEIISDEDFSDIVDCIILNDYKNIPNVIRLPNLNEKLSEKLGLNKDSAFILKKSAAHIRPDRKSGYGQAFDTEEYRQIPQVLREADFAVIDNYFKNFQIVFDDKDNPEKINKLIFNKDELGNYLLTIGKVDRESAFSEERNTVVAVGAAPTIQTLRTRASSTALRASTTTVNDSISQAPEMSTSQEKQDWEMKYFPADAGRIMNFINLEGAHITRPMCEALLSSFQRENTPIVTDELGNIYKKEERSDKRTGNEGPDLVMYEPSGLIEDYKEILLGKGSSPVLSVLVNTLDDIQDTLVAHEEKRNEKDIVQARAQEKNPAGLSSSHMENIPQWAVPFIVNGDKDGLTDAEILQAEKFIKDNRIVTVGKISLPYCASSPEFGMATVCVDMDVLVKEPDKTRTLICLDAKELSQAEAGNYNKELDKFYDIMAMGEDAGTDINLSLRKIFYEQKDPDSMNRIDRREAAVIFCETTKYGKKHTGYMTFDVRKNDKNEIMSFTPFSGNLADEKSAVQDICFMYEPERGLNESISVGAREKSVEKFSIRDKNNINLTYHLLDIAGKNEERKEIERSVLEAFLSNVKGACKNDTSIGNIFLQASKRLQACSSAEKEIISSALSKFNLDSKQKFEAFLKKQMKGPEQEKNRGKEPEPDRGRS